MIKFDENRSQTETLNNYDLIKQIFYVSSMKLLKLLKIPLKVFFLKMLVANFLISQIYEGLI